MPKNQTLGRLIVFSSSKSLNIARAIQANLADQFECTVWEQGALPLNVPILQGLHAKIDDYDFAICVLSPDAKISIAGEEVYESSANVIYEVAVSSAKLGIDRTFVFIPNNMAKFHTPDYIRIRNLVPYTYSTEGNLRGIMGAPCFAVRENASAIGLRKSSTVESFGQKIEYAGAICFRIVNNELQFLTVEFTAGRRIIPKGKVNKDEKITEAALRYAHDEGAIIGTPFSSEIFGFRHARLSPPDEHLIAVKIVQCDYEVVPLAPFRNRRWHSFPDFKSAITQGRSFQYIREARDLLDSVYSAILDGLSPVDQVAAIPYRIVGGIREILLVTSLRSKRWILPKGNIEASEGPDKAAIREALEEAGVRGRIEAALGRYEYFRRSRKYTVQTFLLEVGNLELKWEDRNKRERRWFSAIEAANRVDEEQLKQILLDLARTNAQL